LRVDTRRRTIRRAPARNAVGGLTGDNSVRERTTVRRVMAACVGYAVLTVPAVARAHPGVPPRPHDLWHAWSAEPAVVLGLAVAAWVYARGVRALWRRAGRGRGVATWRVACQAAGLLAVAAALLSPLDALGEALFSAHMAQHLVLMMVAAPLLVLGDLVTAALWALPRSARAAAGRAWRRARTLRAAWGAARRPAAAWLLHVGTLWAWHARGPYESAVRHTGVHVLEHASFLVTALLFWLALADPRPRRRLGFGGAVAYLFAAGLQGTALGALITVATRPWYSVHLATTGPWGLTPLEDQQLAGLLMWIPAGLVYLVALGVELVLALREREAGPRIAALNPAAPLAR
jgi:putative membrane protein